MCVLACVCLCALMIVVAQEEGRSLIADEFKEVTILFTDLRGFTDFASRIEPQDLVLFLNVMYSEASVAPTFSWCS